MKKVTLMILFALFTYLSCDSGGSSNNGGFKVSGTIFMWDDIVAGVKGAGFDDATAYVQAAIVDSGTTHVVVSTKSSIAADGSFTITLDDTVDAAYLIESTTTSWNPYTPDPVSGVAVLAHPANSYEVILEIGDSYGVYALYTLSTENTSTYPRYKFIIEYVTDALTVTGEAIDTGVTTTVNCSFPKGWSWIQQEYTNDTTVNMTLATDSDIDSYLLFIPSFL